MKIYTIDQDSKYASMAVKSENEYLGYLIVGIPTNQQLDDDEQIDSVKLSIRFPQLLEKSKIGDAFFGDFDFIVFSMDAWEMIKPSIQNLGESFSAKIGSAAELHHTKSEYKQLEVERLITDFNLPIDFVLFFPTNIVDCLNPRKSYLEKTAFGTYGDIKVISFIHEKIRDEFIFSPLELPQLLVTQNFVDLIEILGICGLNFSEVVENTSMEANSKLISLSSLSKSQVLAWNGPFFESIWENQKHLFRNYKD